MELVPGSKSNNSTTGITVAVYRLKVFNNLSYNVVATWDSAITKKVMIAVDVKKFFSGDVESINNNLSTSSPNTGSSVSTTSNKTISLAFFASAGPSGDTIGTAGLGHTLGQRVGTTGGSASSNITLQETYEILSNIGSCQASLSGATSRDWATSIVAFLEQAKNIGDTRTITDDDVLINFNTTGRNIGVTQLDVKIYFQNFIDDMWDNVGVKNQMKLFMTTEQKSNLTDDNFRTILKSVIRKNFRTINAEEDNW